MVSFTLQFTALSFFMLSRGTEVRQFIHLCT